MPTLRIFSENTLLHEATASSKESLLEVLQRMGIALVAPCGGSGTCGKCTVTVRFPHSEKLEQVLACQTAAHRVQEVHLDAESTETMAIASGREAVKTSSTQATSDATLTHERVGFAIDLGTTTIVCKLYDLQTRELLATTTAPNPQSIYGADVIARISAAQAGKLQQLQDTVNSVLAKLMARALACADISPKAVCSIVLAGNTTMQSLAAGIDPTPIGKAPFTPSTLFGEMIYLPAAQSCGLATQDAYFVPCIAGYVGGDITADLVALNATQQTQTCILADIGTNGELALLHNGGIATCATAAGPVFEGANITCGMAAFEGAIAHVALTHEQLELITINNAPAKGICGTGIIDVIALLVRLGLIDETGYLIDAEEAPATLLEDVRKRLRPADDGAAFWLTDTIYITQKDIRNVQLAKAALCAGIETLLESANLTTNDVQQVFIAGGFGEFLNIENAAQIGLFPHVLLPQAKSVGNSAIEGASRVLCTGKQGEQNAEHIANTCTYIELSTSAFFNNAYVMAMEF